MSTHPAAGLAGPQGVLRNIGGTAVRPPPDKTAPVVISASSLLVWLPMSMGSMTGYLASLLVAGFSTRRVARTMQNTGPTTAMWRSSRCVGSGRPHCNSRRRSAGIYWPVALAGALISRRCRQAVLLAAVIDGVHDWITRRRNSDVEGKPIGLGAYIVLKRLDDLAYGAGLWTGGAGADVASAQAADQDVIDGSGRSHHAQ